jgi:hypothetical protein
MGICTEENESYCDLATKQFVLSGPFWYFVIFLFYIKSSELSYKELSLSTTTLKSTSSPMTAHNMNGITNNAGSAVM